jgi:HK97 family phage major capsid protein
MPEIDAPLAAGPTPADLAGYAEIEALQRKFVDYRQASDTRLAELESRFAGEADLAAKHALLDQAVSRFDTAVIEAARKVPRAEGVAHPVLAEHRKSFADYLRKGETAKLVDLDGSLVEGKSLSVGSEADGGYLVPVEGERAVLALLREASPIRAIAGSVTISRTLYKRAVVVGQADAGWVGETDARPTTLGPRVAELAFPAMELYAMPAATLMLLDDSSVDIEAWLRDDIARAFAEQEADAFVHGDGVNRPRGFLAVPTVPQNAWSWGSLGFVTSGVEGGLDPATGMDALIDLVYALKSAYRANARFVMSRTTAAAVRKLKDLAGNPLWQPALAQGQPATLLGYPVTECDAMPDMAPGSHSIAFGDFRRGYLVVDRAGIRTLRDPYSAKPYVLFYATKRVGGGVQDFDAIKLLRFSA